MSYSITNILDIYVSQFMYHFDDGLKSVLLPMVICRQKYV